MEVDDCTSAETLSGGLPGTVKVPHQKLSVLLASMLWYIMHHNMAHYKHLPSCRVWFIMESLNGPGPTLVKALTWIV